MLSISVIINTCCLGPKAREVTGSRSPTPHALRSYALSNFIIPRYASDPAVSEIIVVGEYVEGEGFTYVHKPSKEFSCVDALAQRQAGFEASSGDLVVFTHDDHVFAWDALTRISDGFDGDVLLPTRRKKAVDGEYTLPNGAEEGYVSGHAVVMTREMAEKAPWSEVARIHTWDQSHTRLLTEASARIVTSEDIVVYDVEIGVTALEEGAPS